jgi:glutathione S-transferase
MWHCAFTYANLPALYKDHACMHMLIRMARYFRPRSGKSVASKEALDMFNDKSKRAMAKFKTRMRMYMTRHAYMCDDVFCVAACAFCI